jgi:hypothetical protein
MLLLNADGAPDFAHAYMPALQEQVAAREAARDIAAADDVASGSGLPPIQVPDALALRRELQQVSIVGHRAYGILYM